mmetsp:Transcript_13526/g.29404  ORF Transcript_13526/g.29404 Transcript_13526/m.29404 type:complete len:105 (+) Transcript_13526:28-342(+)
MTPPKTSPQQITQEPRPDVGQQEESCRSCLYTGVGTCIGLSGYFLYSAMEEEGHQTMKQQQAQPHHKRLLRFMLGNPAPKKHRPFLFALSAASAVAGAYRLYLD